MPLTLELPKDLEERLKTDARNEGVPVETYALRLLDDRSKAEAKPKTGAEVIETWKQKGVLGSLPADLDSQAHARELRRTAEHRDWS